MQDPRDPAQDRKTDVDQEVGAAAAFEEDGDGRQEDCDEVQEDVALGSVRGMDRVLGRKRGRHRDRMGEEGEEGDRVEEDLRLRKAGWPLRVLSGFEVL